MSDIKCSRCGKHKPASEFKRDYGKSKRSRVSFCNDCDGRHLDVSLLEDPSELVPPTFWKIWRHYTLVPLRKYLLRGLTDSVEISIVNQVLDELEIELIEFRHVVTVKMKRLRSWRSMRESAKKNGQTKKVKEAYATLGIALPKRGAEPPIKEIKKVFKIRARECHPDFHPDSPEKEEEFNEVRDAYETLIGHYTGG